MRRVVDSLHRLFAFMRSTPRHLWWSTFALMVVLGTLWAIASPLFSGPDENAHVVRAVSVARGQVLGDEPKGKDRAGLIVEVPDLFEARKTGCFAFAPRRPYACFHTVGSTDDARILTTAGRHPPLYYAAAGVFSAPLGSSQNRVYLMRFVGVLVAALLVASAVRTLAESGAGQWARAGVAVAITPMVLYVTGIVNPSAWEITAALALWVCGFTLVRDVRAGRAVSSRLLARVGVAAILLVLSRQLGPIWLGVVAVALLGYGGIEAAKRLLRERAVRWWSAAVGVATVAQVAWLVYAKPLDSSFSGAAKYPDGTWEFLQDIFGRQYGYFRDMVGTFGWLDTLSPQAAVLLVTAALGGLVFLALARAPGRELRLVLAVIAATVLVPVLLEWYGGRDSGFFWQGRYTLPLAVGVPLLAAMSAAAGEREPRADAVVIERRRFLVGIGVCVVVAHVLAFAQAFRRYTVGTGGPLAFWSDPAWDPPIHALVVLIAFVVTITAFVVMLLGSGGEASTIDRRATDRAPGSSEQP